ncbi:MAG: flavodoxin domain-containing protein [Sarcina sp.]
MNKIIIYGSNYGTSQAYAEELSKKTLIKALSYTCVKDISKFETIIYIGGLYAGGIKGLKNILKLMPENNQPKMILATVGLADVTNKENTENIKKSIKVQVPNELFNNAKIFHLRGGIDYSKLKFTHKTMMTLLYHK